MSINKGLKRLTNLAAGVYDQIDAKNTTKIFKNANLNSKSAQLGSEVANYGVFKGIKGTAQASLSAKQNNAPISLLGAVKQGHMVKDAASETGERVSKSAVAGTVGTLGVAGRIASGGGVYKDKNGNTNIAGIPFI